MKPGIGLIVLVIAVAVVLGGLALGYSHWQATKPVAGPHVTCIVGGCSGQLCLSEAAFKAPGNAGTTCEWSNVYACYRTAKCEVGANGECGWRDTPELRACIAAGGPGEQTPPPTPSSCGVCPQYTPPAWDKNECIKTGGKFIPPVKDTCGCFGPPQCELAPPPPAKVTPPPPPPSRPPPQPSPPPTAPPPPPAVKTSNFNLEADDHGFYPSNEIKVAKGSHVKLTFTVRTTNVYYGGLDFRSTKFNTVGAKPGDSVSVEFTADESFSFSSYWPLSNAFKASGSIVVE